MEAVMSFMIIDQCVNIASEQMFTEGSKKISHQHGKLFNETNTQKY